MVWVSEADGTTSFGHHAVCVIDVLGQKDKLALWPTFVSGGIPSPEFITAVKGTVGTVLGFRGHFLKYFEAAQRCSIPDKIDALPDDARSMFHRIRYARVKVERFSDTFVFSSAIPNEYGDVSVVPVANLVGACCMAMLVSLAARQPVRGGLTVGMGAELEDRSFYGPALARAHQLESEIAGYPRIVVCEEVLDLLNETQVYSSDRLVNQAMRAISLNCRSKLCQDVDGCWIVDFLGKSARDEFGGDNQLLDTVRLAYQFVSAQASNYKAERKGKLALRYYLLQHYIESRLPLWGLPSIDQM